MGLVFKKRVRLMTGAVLLLMMGSIGGVQIFEIILVGLMEILLCFLVSHSRL